MVAESQDLSLVIQSTPGVELEFVCVNCDNTEEHYHCTTCDEVVPSYETHLHCSYPECEHIHNNTSSRHYHCGRQGCKKRKHHEHYSCCPIDYEHHHCEKFDCTNVREEHTHCLYSDSHGNECFEERQHIHCNENECEGRVGSLAHITHHCDNCGLYDYHGCCNDCDYKVRNYYIDPFGDRVEVSMYKVNCAIEKHMKETSHSVTYHEAPKERYYGY